MQRYELIDGQAVVSLQMVSKTFRRFLTNAALKLTHGARVVGKNPSIFSFVQIVTRITAHIFGLS
jgi:hypothetical protein